MLRNNQKGAALLEFAIVLPFLLVLVFGVIEFGLIAYNKQVITNASREGARSAITKTLNSDGTLTAGDIVIIRDIITAYCDGNLINLVAGAGGLISPPTVSGPDGQNDITVRVTYGYNLLFSGLVGFNSGIALTGQTVMRMEPAL
jgi:Flp pilus assembly protein TadG